MCAVVDSPTLEVIHHEMGHIEYQMLYAHQPFVFQNSPNPGFHEAIGNVISLSVMTPDYLRQIGLLNKKETHYDDKSTINYLMSIALRYGVSPQYSYIIDYWRNKVYRGEIKSKELNEKYWEYRLKYQGVCPPVKRTEKDFDIGAKFHIAAGVEYYREFLRLGKSKDGKKILGIISNNKVHNLDVSAMLEYFKPLMKWLKAKNKKESKGWKSKDPMSCPTANRS
ncbi:angiotensin-converting enzyme [Nephila pilipes]|uniref:Angiotensin-converting enzyme n=1 Tax=Nephila pilipes TaxID=299642 RepID=A0A8X6UL83_NEPPI|nr:angiotensin-converting enzyme [Nephila pilipes]